MSLNNIGIHFILVWGLAFLVGLNCVFCETDSDNDISLMYMDINTMDEKKCDIDEPCSCTDDEYCVKYYTPNIAFANVSSLTKYPYCNDDDICTCDNVTCLSRSKTNEDVEFYYCGPCGRVGSVCNDSCSSSVAQCEDGFCNCADNGEFYEMYYCYIPYYGYEIALQMAIATCIIIALCIMVASVYNAIGFRRFREMQGIRQLFGSDGVRESPPDDIPPKYDDVVEDLPTYQDALKMCETSGENFTGGIVNLGFEDDGSVSTETLPPKYKENSRSVQQAVSVHTDGNINNSQSFGSTENITGSVRCSRCGSTDRGIEAAINVNNDAVSVGTSSEMNNTCENRNAQISENNVNQNKTLNEGAHYIHKENNNNNDNDQIATNSKYSTSNSLQERISIHNRNYQEEAGSMKSSSDAEDKITRNIQNEIGYSRTNFDPAKSKSYSTGRTVDIKMVDMPKSTHNSSYNHIQTIRKTSSSDIETNEDPDENESSV